MKKKKAVQEDEDYSDDEWPSSSDSSSGHSPPPLIPRVLSTKSLPEMDGTKRTEVIWIGIVESLGIIHGPPSQTSKMIGFSSKQTGPNTHPPP
jgi:hypothetical protein